MVSGLALGIYNCLGRGLEVRHAYLAITSSENKLDKLSLSWLILIDEASNVAGAASAGATYCRSNDNRNKCIFANQIST